ncbi:hypothetical protein B6E66_13925 [Streptomyces maremycinicus]|nr:hypothetical protein B6E66_13925 [Streptomyces sp. B9173]
MSSDAQNIRQRSELQEQIGTAERDVVRGAVFDAGVQPVTQWLGRLLLEGEEREVLRQEILSSLADTAGQLVCPDALCAFYEFSSDHRRLERMAPAGESSLPLTYSEADDNGSYMVFLAKSPGGKPKYVPDVDQAHLDGGDRIRLAPGYKTALFLPVRVGSEPIGLLIIQTPRPGEIPAPLAGEMLDGNYRKLYAIASLLGASRIAHRTPVRINGQRNNQSPTGEPSTLPGSE